MDPFEMNLDGLPEDVKAEFEKLKTKVFLEKVSNEILPIAMTTMELAMRYNLVAPQRLGNILLMIAGISLDPNQIEEFSLMCTQFAANKISEILKSGGPQSDALLDNINKQFDANDESRGYLFDILEGKVDIKTMRDKLKDKKDGDTMEQNS